MMAPLDKIVQKKVGPKNGPKMVKKNSAKNSPRVQSKGLVVQSKGLVVHFIFYFLPSMLALPTSPAPCWVAIDSPLRTRMAKYITFLFVGRLMSVLIFFFLWLAAAALHRFAGPAAQYRSKRQKVRGIGRCLPLCRQVLRELIGKPIKQCNR